MKHHLSSAVFWIFALITLAGMVWWDLSVPVSIDDFNFRTIAVNYERFWDCADADIASFGDAWTSVVNHTLYVNNRLADSVSILLQPLGRTFEGILLGIIGALAACMAVWCVRRKSSGTAMMLSCLLLWTAYPWTDHFLSLDYQLNYTPSCVLVCLSVFLMPLCPTMRLRGFILVAAVGFVAGWWHEGFGAALTAYAAVYCLCTGLNRRQIILTAAVAAGFAVNVVGGTILRLQSFMPAVDRSVFSSALTNCITQLWPVIIAMLLVAVKLLRHRERCSSAVLRYAPMLAASLTGVAVSVVLGLVDRALWPAQLFAVLIIIDICSPALERLHPGGVIVIAAPAAIGYALWFADLVKTTRTIAAENRKVEAILAPRRQRAQNIYFADITTGDSIAWHLRGVVYQPMEGFYDLMGMYAYYAHKRKEMVVVPKRFAGLPFEEWDTVAGSAGMRGQWPMLFTEGDTGREAMLTFGPFDSRAPLSYRLMNRLRYGGADTISVTVPTWAIPMITAEGDTLTWYAWHSLPRTVRNRPLLRADSLPARVETVKER